jgi:hypothetical protein
MPTKNPRINITFQTETSILLESIAKKEKRPLAHVARDLILNALELQEDQSLSKIAAARDIEGSAKLKHDSVWS